MRNRKTKPNYDYYLDLCKHFKYDHNFEYSDDINFKSLYQKTFLISKNVGRGCRYFAVLTHQPKTLPDLLDLCKKVEAYGNAVTKEKLVFSYGEEEGLKRWNHYRDLQAKTNTFEYKSQKYGMTKEEFDEYNKSRATTKDGMINRYGEEEGLKRWKNYCDLQAYTNTKGHLGSRYEEVNRQKAHTYEVYLERYKDHNIAVQKLNEYYNLAICSFSKVSQKLFDELILNEPFLDKKVYYATKNGEYGIFSYKENKYFKYDFVCPDLKLCIEFNGDHYHGNPTLYRPDDFLKGRGQSHRTAKMAWEFDEKKNNAIKDERNYDTIVIWESDYLSDKKLTIQRILDYVRGRI